MRKNNRKGFTIVELVIVIAVIAILAGVLIPTFAGIVAKAQKSAAEQEAANAYKEAYALAIADGKIDASGETQTSGNYKFTFGGDIAAPSVTSVAVKSGSKTAQDNYLIAITNGVVTATKGSENNAESWSN